LWDAVEPDVLWDFALVACDAEAEALWAVEALADFFVAGCAELELSAIATVQSTATTQPTFTMLPGNDPETLIGIVAAWPEKAECASRASAEDRRQHGPTAVTAHDPRNAMSGPVTVGPGTGYGSVPAIKIVPS
jgi:hypothetical protein